MDWIQVGQDHLRAAKLLLGKHPRSAVSRAYYAAHSVLTDRLVRAGWVPAGNRQMPPHDRQSRLLQQHLGANPQLRALIGKLYTRRIDADYNRQATIGNDIARQAVRDACALFILLKVQEVTH